MSFTNEELRAFASQANQMIAEEFELWGLPGQSPQITPAMVRIVAQLLPNNPMQAPKTIAASPLHVSPAIAPSNTGKLNNPEIESAIIAKLKELSINGFMPTQEHYEKNRGSLPTCSYLRKYGYSWAELARKIGLTYVTNLGANQARLAKSLQKEAGAAVSSNGFHRTGR